MNVLDRESPLSEILAYIGESFTEPELRLKLSSEACGGAVWTCTLRYRHAVSGCEICAASHGYTIEEALSGVL
jgi:hypothetical protein